VFQQMATAFPNKKWKPGEFVATADAILGHYQTAEPIDNQIANLYLQQMKLGIQKQGVEDRGEHMQNQDATATGRLEESTRSHDMQHTDRQDAIAASIKRVQMSTNSAERRQSMADATRMAAADLVQSSTDERQAKLLEFRQAAQDAGLDEKEWQAQFQANLKEEGMSDAFSAKLFGSRLAAGDMKAPLPVKAPAANRPPPPVRGGGGGGNAVPPAAVADLKKNPTAQMRKHFDDVFGAGAAAAALKGG
jgi:hypothetical protein